MSNKKTVFYKGLEITGDANKIDRLIYDKEHYTKSTLVDNKDIEDIIYELYKFNRRFIPERKHMTNQETTRWIKQFILCISDELSELLGEIPWKHWKNYEQYDFNMDNIKGELADILIFTFGICGILDIEPMEIFEEIRIKNEVNITRQKTGY